MTNQNNDNISLDNFSPKKAELIALAEKYKRLEIIGIEDTEGYVIVDTARKDLKRKRREVESFVEDYLKKIRDKYNSYRQEVLDTQEDHIGIIASIEKELENKQEKIDEEKLRIARAVLLPDRKERLLKIGIILSDDELLSISPEDFTIFYNEKHSQYLEKKENELKEEKERIEREKELEAAKKQARIEAEELAKKEAERKAEESKEREERLKKEAEEAKKRAVEEAERKAEEEKQKIIEEHNRKEAENIAVAKKLELEEKEKKERLEKQKKYQKFLSDNGYTEENKTDFYIAREENKILLYKKIATYANPQ